AEEASDVLMGRLTFAPAAGRNGTEAVPYKVCRERPPCRSGCAARMGKRSVPSQHATAPCYGYPPPATPASSRRHSSSPNVHDIPAGPLPRGRGSLSLQCAYLPACPGAFLMPRPTRTCPGPLSRRHFLKVGALALGGLAVNGVSALRVTAKEGTTPLPDTSVIFVWLPGGPPHMETDDMKPEAPAEYRGEFKPIKTNVPGIDVCELLPLHAKLADKYTLVRSVHHAFADHGGGHKRFLTGRDPLQPTGFVNDYPMVGSMVAKLFETRKVGVPNYIACVDQGRQGIDVFSFGSAYLGPATHPFWVPGDPSAPKFEVKNLALSDEMHERLKERTELLIGLDTTPASRDRSGTMAAMD